MKLKSATFLTAAAIALTAVNANANLLFDPYIGATAGIGGVTTFIDSESHSDMAISYGAIIGLDIPFVRIEGEYNYLKDKDITANLVMGNAYLKMPTGLIAPYIGAGIGTTFHSEGENDTNIDDTMAYQGMLGTTFNIPVLPFKIDAEARALYIPDAFSVAGDDAKILHYDVRAKLRYVF